MFLTYILFLESVWSNSYFFAWTTSNMKCIKGSCASMYLTQENKSICFFFIKCVCFILFLSDRIDKGYTKSHSTCIKFHRPRKIAAKHIQNVLVFKYMINYFIINYLFVQPHNRMYTRISWLSWWQFYGANTRWLSKFGGLYQKWQSLNLAVKNVIGNCCEVAPIILL